MLEGLLQEVQTISSAAYPLMVLSFGLIVIILLFIPILNIIVLLGLTAAIWFLGAMWIKIAATVAILPVICLIIVLLMSWLLFHFGKHIRYLLSQGLLRALEHEKGIFIFISVTFSCIGGIAVAIAKLF